MVQVAVKGYKMQPKLLHVLLCGVLFLLAYKQLNPNEGCFQYVLDATAPVEQKIAGEQAQKRTGPFLMPIKGNAFEIFQPTYDMEESKKNPSLFSHPNDFIATFAKRIAWVNTMTQGGTPETQHMTVRDHAVFMYLEMMKNLLSAIAFDRAEFSMIPEMGGGQKTTKVVLQLEKRKLGNDWTYAGDTMTGWARIDNVRDCLKDVIQNNIKGDYIETGVWRGGSSVFARAVLSAMEPNTERVSYVCDSFAGLPPGKASLDIADLNWDNNAYLAVSNEVVANNFIKYNLLDANVVFAKGFFNETMPPLREHIKALSVMRLDGDMYESTVDVLYNLYDKLSIGGYAIIDDWFGFPARTACEDFFKVHGINPEIIPIDDISAYWKKTEEVDIQYWRYQQYKFKP